MASFEFSSRVESRGKTDQPIRQEQSYVYVCIVYYRPTGSPCACTKISSPIVALAELHAVDMHTIVLPFFGNVLFQRFLCRWVWIQWCHNIYHAISMTGICFEIPCPPRALALDSGPSRMECQTDQHDSFHHRQLLHVSASNACWASPVPGGSTLKNSA
jgi:hypothetical protein